MKVIRVVSNCTKAKMETTLPVKARMLYTGIGHVFVKRGVNLVQQRTGIVVEWSIMSALHGYVPSTKRLMPYDFTFAGKSKIKLKQCRAAHKANKEMMESFLRRSPEPELQIVGMSKAYHFVFPIERLPRAKTILIGPADLLKRYEDIPNIVTLVADPKYASAGLGTNLVGVTGKLVELMLKGVYSYGTEVHWHNMANAKGDVLTLYLKDLANAKSR